MYAVPDSKQFYFVNKTEKSTHLSRSLPHENTAVQRHVQTGRKRIRSAKSTKSTNKSLPTSKLLPPTSLLVLPEHGSQSVQESAIENNTNYVKAENKQPYQSPTSFNVQPDGSSRLESLLFQKSLYKPDPFDSASVSINRSVASLLHYYKYYHFPSQWPNELALLRQGVYMWQDSVLNIIRSAVSNRLVMSCLLSSAACRLQFVDRLPSHRIAGTEHFYMNEALHLMAFYVTNANLDDTAQLMLCLHCISFLSSAEAYRGDMSAAKAHRDAAVQLLKYRGGLASVKDQNLQGQLAMSDLFLSCVDLEPCMFDSPYDPGPAKLLDLTELELATPCITATATSLLNRSTSFLPSELTIIIEDLLESHTIKSRISISSMSPTRALQVTHWITLRNMAIRNRLLALSLADPRHHALRIAIIMWTLFAMNFTGRASTVKIMAPQLENTLSQILTSMWEENEDVRLWILLVGLYCANEGGETSAWFMQECHSLRHVLSPTTTATAPNMAEQLENFQCKFFFDVSVQKVRTCVLAEKLQQNFG